MPAQAAGTEKLTTKEIAARINEYLRRFENDPEISNYEHDGRTLKRYFNSWANSAGRWVNVTYISYQGRVSLTKNEALRYLKWLDAGNVGRHYEALRESAAGGTGGTR